MFCNVDLLSSIKPFCPGEADANVLVLNVHHPIPTPLYVQSLNTKNSTGRGANVHGNQYNSWPKRQLQLDTATEFTDHWRHRVDPSGTMNVCVKRGFVCAELIKSGPKWWTEQKLRNVLAESSFQNWQSYPGATKNLSLRVSTHCAADTLGYDISVTQGWYLKWNGLN